MVMGSPGYMAPERYTGGRIDRRVDVFSCGVLPYELLTGACHFVGGPDVVLYQALHGAAPPPSRATTIRTPPACFDAIRDRRRQRLLSARARYQNHARVATTNFPEIHPCSNC